MQYLFITAAQRDRYAETTYCHSKHSTSCLIILSGPGRLITATLFMITPPFLHNSPKAFLATSPTLYHVASTPTT